VRTPCRRIAKGLTSADLGRPDYDKALWQHGEYVEALKTCGLDVTVLPADDRYPDSVFVEDTAVLTARCAVLTHPGAKSRRGEVDAVREAIAGFYETVEEIKPPGTLEGGDVMGVEEVYYIGLSKRTNAAGARQLVDILRRYGMEGAPIAIDDLLHLKTGVNYIDRNCLLITGEFLQEAAFRSFRQIRVDPREAYAANCLWLNGTVLVPQGFPETRTRIEAAGYETIAVDVSEFRKLDGGLSCLSLRF
jgi:dimethylargininase